MMFSDLMVGDYFIWPMENMGNVDAVNVNVKIARSDEGGGFAIDLVTRKERECPNPSPSTPDRYWIPASTPVIKLNGRF